MNPNLFNDIELYQSFKILTTISKSHKVHNVINLQYYIQYLWNLKAVRALLLMNHFENN